MTAFGKAIYGTIAIASLLVAAYCGHALTANHYKTRLLEMHQRERNLAILYADAAAEVAVAHAEKAQAIRDRGDAYVGQVDLLPDRPGCDPDDEWVRLFNAHATGAATRPAGVVEGPRATEDDPARGGPQDGAQGPH